MSRGVSPPRLLAYQLPVAVFADVFFGDMVLVDGDGLLFRRLGFLLLELSLLLFLRRGGLLVLGVAVADSPAGVHPEGCHLRVAVLVEVYLTLR